jgi:hypothetical protein
VDAPAQALEIRVQQLSAVAAELSSLVSEAEGCQGQEAQEPAGPPAASSAIPAATTEAGKAAGRGGRYVKPAREPMAQRAPRSRQAADATEADKGSAQGQNASAVPRVRRGRPPAAPVSGDGSATPAPAALPVTQRRSEDASWEGGPRLLLDQIRSVGSAAELRPLLQPLGPTGPVRASAREAAAALQQLPRLAQTAAALALSGSRGLTAAQSAAAAAAELSVVKELHGRLLQRLSSSQAVVALGSRPAAAQLPHYVAAAQACAELRAPPPRAFAAALRGLLAAASEPVALEAPGQAPGEGRVAAQGGSSSAAAEQAPRAPVQAEAGVLAAAAAAVSVLDGTVAPGVLERVCARLAAEAEAVSAAAASSSGPHTPGASEAGAPAGSAERVHGQRGPRSRLLGWRALVAAGHVAPLGPQAAEAARKVLAAAAAAATAAQPVRSTRYGLSPAPEDGKGVADSVLAAASGVLAAAGAGVASPHVLLRDLERACRDEDGEAEAFLAALGPEEQLLLARAFATAGYSPEVRAALGEQA